MVRKCQVYCLLAVLLLAPVVASAVDLSSVRINGFVSQGYMKSQRNNFLDPTSLDGTFMLTEVGLVTTAQPIEKLRVAAQFLYRRLGQEGGDRVTLDWGFGDYRYNDELGFRAGKIKMPMGFYNEGRDSDMLRNMVFLPQSIYDETWRSFMSTALGAGLYGDISAGEAGDFEYQFVLGEITVPDDSYLVQAGLVDLINANLIAGFGTFLTKFDYECDNAIAASIIYNTPVE